MQISSATIALTLLNQDSSPSALAVGKLAAGDGSPSHQVAPAAATATTAESTGSDKYVPAEVIADMERFEQIQTRWSRLGEFHAALADGSRSPFDAEIIEYIGAERSWTPSNSDSRLVFPGVFISSPGVAAGTQAPQRDAAFLSRRDAMANAYHFATALVETTNYVVADAREIAAHPDKYLDASGQLYGAGAGGGTLGGDWEAAMRQGTDMMLFYRDKMESMAASLANMFSFDTTSVTTGAYEGSFQGFSISHGTLGKIMDVDANGKITLYDAQGTAWTAEDYDAAKIDGGIPELHNDMIRQADDRAELASLGLKREDSGRVVRV